MPKRGKPLLVIIHDTRPKCKPFFGEFHNSFTFASTGAFETVFQRPNAGGFTVRNQDFCAALQNRTLKFSVLHKPRYAAVFPENFDRKRRFPAYILLTPIHCPPASRRGGIQCSFEAEFCSRNLSANSVVSSIGSKISFINIALVPPRGYSANASSAAASCGSFAGSRKKKLLPSGSAVSISGVMPVSPSACSCGVRYC